MVWIPMIPALLLSIKSDPLSPPQKTIPPNPRPIHHFKAFAIHVVKDIRPVRLLIQDLRVSFSESNISQRIEVAFVDVVDCHDGEWRVSSVDIFRSGRIGIPDREKHEYTEYFVAFNPDQGTETLAKNLAHIVIPKGSVLELRAHRV
ncbi:hypothetical protein B0H13DRAFT_2392702 [Mycena leptocephala]|nr:hypothetical protein B0H13DRAFT_2392702 [Mycena leptocephala]